MARRGRWQTAGEVLALVGRHPGITRAEVARALGLSTSSATEVTARLRELELVSEVPAPVHGRGRPTTVLRAHPRGPLVLVLDLRQSNWRSTVVSLDGAFTEPTAQRHRSRRPEAVLARLHREVVAAQSAYGDRLRAVALAVAGTVRGEQLLQASTLGWSDVDLRPVTAGTGLPLLAGNDATLSGVAEARTGAAAGARTALHLIVEVGVGGTLIIGGVPAHGATGGEYGHVPFGDRSLSCPCGARGCWDLETDGRALARHLREPAPADPYGYAEEVLRRPANRRTSMAVTRVAGALAAGIAGLVNAHDPDVVTLGGLAVGLRAAAPDAFARSYHEGLMAFRRSTPPPVLDSAHSTDGAVRGAAALGLDHLTTERAMADWAAPRGG